MLKFTRRRFLMTLPLLGGGALCAEALIEPGILETKRLDMRALGIGKCIAQFSDLHYRGDWSFGQELVARIHQLEPDYVFFTGDLVEHRKRTHLKEALKLIASIQVPVFGVPGNHDPLDRESISDCREAYRATGGDFLNNERVKLEGFVVHGSRQERLLEYQESLPKVLLCHYPIVGDRATEAPYDLILAGHSHGGQVRLPLVGPLVLPPSVGRYDRGFYEAPAGKLYVNVGAGTYRLPIRLFCRPEITEILI